MAEAGAPIARFNDVHKSFSGQAVLNGVSLDIRAGETTVVMGPSGAGKSVLLKHVVGLLQPDSGSVEFEGKRIDTLGERALSPVRRRIGFLFQMSALFDSMNVEANVAYPLDEHLRLDKEDRARRVKEALRRVGLDGVQAKLPAQLSGGQKKRVALARAIILEPALILYDEPTTGLDPIRADGINQLIVQLKRDLGSSAIVVTHDLASARAVGDRFVMLFGGQIVADGVWAELQRSEHPYVQRFLAGQYDPNQDGQGSREPAA